MSGVHLEDVKLVSITDLYQGSPTSITCDQYEGGVVIGHNTACFPKMLDEDITTATFDLGLTSADFGGVTPDWIRIRIDGTVSNENWTHGCVGPTDPDALVGCDTVFSTGATDIISHPTQIAGIRFTQGGPYPFPSVFTLEESANTGVFLNPSPTFTASMIPGYSADEFWAWGDLTSLELHWAGEAASFGFGFGLYIQGFSNTTDDGDATPIYIQWGDTDGVGHDCLFESVQRGHGLQSACPWIGGTTTLCFDCAHPDREFTAHYGPLGTYPDGHSFDDTGGSISALAEMDSFNPDYCTIHVSLDQAFDLKCHQPLCADLGCGPLYGLPGPLYRFRGVGGVQIMNLDISSGGRFLSMDIAPWEPAFISGTVTFTGGVPDHLPPGDVNLYWPWKVARNMVPALGHDGVAFSWTYRYSVEIVAYYIESSVFEPAGSFVYHSYY